MFKIMKSLYLSKPWTYFRLLSLGGLGLASQDYSWNQSFSFSLFGLVPTSPALWSLQCFLALNAGAGAYDLIDLVRRRQTPIQEQKEPELREIPLTRAAAAASKEG
jgi:hypothetical protein